MCSNKLNVSKLRPRKSESSDVTNPMLVSSDLVPIGANQTEISRTLFCAHAWP